MRINIFQARFIYDILLLRKDVFIYGDEFVGHIESNNDERYFAFKIPDDYKEYDFDFDKFRGGFAMTKELLNKEFIIEPLAFIEWFMANLDNMYFDDNYDVCINIKE